MIIANISNLTARETNSHVLRHLPLGVLPKLYLERVGGEVVLKVEE
jgi:hypothetical protein